MRVIVAGSRSITDREFVWGVLSQQCDISVILSGEAPGPDRFGKEWARAHKLPVKVFLAEWKRCGKAAGILRNLQMAKEGDRLLAFWDGQSRGTAHMIQCMRRAGKPVVIVTNKGVSHANEARLPGCS